MKLSKNKGKPGLPGFTMKEMIIVVVIVSILIAIAVPAMRTAKTDATNTGLDATAKSLNEAALRARLKGDEDPRISGDNADDKNKAIDYLISKGYVK